MQYYKPIKIALILIPTIVLAILVYKNICPSGELDIEYNLCQDSPFFSRLSPNGRVLDIEKHLGYCDQTMVIDPVYFDVRLPQSFRQAELTIWYQKTNAETRLKIGPRLTPQDWSWDLQDVNFYSPDNDWSIGRASFDLTKIKMDKNRLRFLISSPELDKADQSIKFKRIQIKFIKPPVALNNLNSKIKNYLKQLF